VRIHPELRVSELVLQYPETLPTLAAVGIDTCCGAGESLAHAAARAGLTFDQLLARLEGRGTSSPTAARPSCGCEPRSA
jgi:iron-sulfur cluster repair protein YtfE (RIC family)